MNIKSINNLKRSPKPPPQNLAFLEALVWVLAIYTVSMAISINVGARNFNVTTLKLPFFGECQMMQMLVYGTSLVLPAGMLALHIVYWLYQRQAKNTKTGELRLPSSLGKIKVPPAYRNKVAVMLAVVALVLPAISYVDLTYQLQKYCRIVPDRVTNVQNVRQIAESDTLGGTGMFLFPHKYPGGNKNSTFYFVNHYKNELIPEGKSGRAGLVKVTAIPFQMLAVGLFGLASLASTGLIFWRARSRKSDRQIEKYGREKSAQAGMAPC